jgi:predicted ATP-grasp superfamily ATP-dependent carboligase
LSLSLLCAGGAGRLLACNRQQIAVRDGRVRLDAVLVNAVRDTGGRFAALAEQVAQAVPGLWGYVGVDLVLTPDGPVLLEINPRLTTSYCGLRLALGFNTAALVLSLLAPGGSRLAGMTHDALADATVEIRTEPSHAG